MSTEYQRADYPITGPDITTLYVHHAPPFLAGVLDFLFTDAEVRSKGAIVFPSTRQCGYVWFDSRLYGHAPGRVYGQLAWPWLHRTAATVNTINVDCVLAEGEGRFYATLLNQVSEPQKVRVTFDSKALGRAIEGAEVTVMLENKPSLPLKIQRGSVELTLPPMGLATLTLGGVNIDVPTHRLVPPEHFALPAGGLVRKQLPGTKLEAVGTMLEVPPFTWRDLYVSVTAGIDDVHAGTLYYRLGEGPEQAVQAREFPWEWTVRLPSGSGPVNWRVELTTADGRVEKSE